jgi:hypothetical protein
MFKKLLFAALIAASFSSAKAQIVTSKCPCDTLLKWHYERKGAIETLTNPDVKGFIEIDWLNETVTTLEGKFKIKRYAVSADKPEESLEFGGQKLVILFTPTSRYVGHILD